jgi:phosphoribosylformylglycinamidine synthase I
MKPPVLILHAPGTNRDRDVAEAFALAGAEPTIRTLADVVATPGLIAEHRLVCLPGGFSFGDDLGAGQVFAHHLRHSLGDALRAHIAKGRPILGICNGFQALMKAGFFEPTARPGRTATLTRNARAQFECRWVTLTPNPSSPSPWLTDLGPIECPVAHGEGRVVTSDPDTAAALTGPQAAFRYVPSETDDGYPGNPNGSLDHLAGLTDPTGLVLGLMPHPEDHIHPFQHPGFHTHRDRLPGLPLFQAGVRLAA